VTAGAVTGRAGPARGRVLGGLPAAVAAATFVGTVVGERAGPGPAGVPAAAGLALGGMALLWALRHPVRPGRRPGWAAAAVPIACCLLATAATQRALHGLVRSPVAGPVEARVDARLRATLAQDPGGRRFAAWAVARASSFTGPDGRSRAAGGRLVKLRATGDAASRLAVLAAGDRVEVEGWFEPADGYDARLRWKHVAGRFRVRRLLAFSGPSSPLDRVANALRARVLAGGASLPAAQRGLLAGFLLGDTRAIPERTVEEFRASGLSHLLAVSGSNVAFVLALAAPVLRRRGYRARFALGALVVVVFGAMTRWEPSVLRAVAMALTAMTASLLGRPSAGTRVLALAVTALLLADPFLSHSVGFGLSVAASAGILFLGGPVTRRLRGPRVLREVLGITIAAQIGTAPLLLAVFGSVPVVSVAANLLAVPVAEPLTVWGLAAGVVGGPVRGVQPVLAGALQFPSYVMLRWVESVASVASRVPLALDSRGAVGALSGFLAFVALAGARRGARGARGGRRREPPIRSSTARRSSASASATPSASGQGSGTASRHTRNPKWMPPR